MPSTSFRTRVWRALQGRAWPWVALLLILAFCAVVRWRLRDCPLERDEGEYAYAGQLMLQGIPPYKYAYSMKFPGVFAAYAVIMALFGQSPAGIHTGLILVNAACSFLLFLLGRRLVNASFGLVAAGTYAIASMGQDTLGLAGHATHFINLFVLAGFLALWQALFKQQNWRYLLSGLLFGLAILMKQQALPMVLFAGLFLLYQHLRSGPIAWRAMMVRLSLLGVGVILPVAVTCLLLYLLGVLGRFWFWTIQYAAQYGREKSLRGGWENFQLVFSKVALPALSLWLLGGLGLILLIFNKSLRATAPFILGLLASSFLATSAGLFFREHYFLLLFPALGVLVAVAIHSLPRMLPSKSGTLAPILSAALFAVGLAYPLYAQADCFFLQTPIEACRATYGPSPFIESVVLGRYIKTHCPPDQTIAVLGSEPQILFYTHRRSATGYIYTYGLMENQPYATRMQREMAAEIEAAHPEYVIWVGLPYSWLVRAESDKWILDWASRYIQKMEPVAVVDYVPNGIVYRWDKQAAEYSPQARPFIAVYRRKPGQ